MASRLISSCSKLVQQPAARRSLFPQIRLVSTSNPVPIVAIKGKARKRKPQLKLKTDTPLFVEKSKKLFEQIKEGLKDMEEADPENFRVKVKQKGVEIHATQVGMFYIDQDFSRNQVTYRGPEGMLCRYEYNSTHDAWKDHMDGHNILELLSRTMIDSRVLYGMSKF